MNKKNIVTKENIAKVADFLEKACDDFKEDGEGCRRFKLSNDLALYVGWSDGYDMADTDIIKSKKGQRLIEGQDNPRTCGWAVNAAIKVRNDYDWSDFDFLDYPFYEDGDCWDDGVSVSPNLNHKDYEALAKSFLEDFVAMTNAHAKGELSYE